MVTDLPADRSAPLFPASALSVVIDLAWISFFSKITGSSGPEIDTRSPVSIFGEPRSSSGLSDIPCVSTVTTSPSPTLR